MADKRNLKQEMNHKGRELDSYIIHQNNGTIVNAYGQVFRSVNNNGLYEPEDNAVIPRGIQSQVRNLLKRFGWYNNDRSGSGINKKRKRLVGYFKKCPRIEWVAPNIVKLIPPEIEQEYQEYKVNKDVVSQEAPVDKKRHFVHRLIYRLLQVVRKFVSTLTLIKHERKRGY